MFVALENFHEELKVCRFWLRLFPVFSHLLHRFSRSSRRSNVLKCGPCDSDGSWRHSLHEAFNDQCSNWDSSKVFVWIKRSQRSCVLSVGINLPYHHDLQVYFCICSWFQSEPRQTEACPVVCQQPLRVMAWRHVDGPENTKGLGFHSNRPWQCPREKAFYVRQGKGCSNR